MLVGLLALASVGIGCGDGDDVTVKEERTGTVESNVTIPGPEDQSPTTPSGATTRKQK